MAAQKVRRKPAEVTIPRLSDQTMRQRARRAVDRSITGLIYYHFSIVPERSDMEHLRRLAERAEGGEIYTRLTNAMRQFSLDRPESVINRYYSQTGSVGFLVAGEGESASVAFNPGALASDVRRSLDMYRSLLVNTITDLSREGYPLRQISLKDSLYNLGPELSRTFAYYLDIYLNAKGSSLPLTASLDKNGDLIISKRS